MRSASALLILPALFLFLTALSFVLSSLRLDAVIATAVGFGLIGAVATIRGHA